GIRLLLVVYPLFVGSVYLLCSYLPQKKLQSVQKELAEFTESANLQESRRGVQKRREEQREEMEKLVSRLEAIPNGTKRGRTPRHIANVADDAGVRLSRISAEGQESISDREFDVMKVGLVGEYRGIVEFFSKVALSDNTVIYIRNFTIRAGDGAENRKAAMEVAILQGEG
ncbi:MAG: hypothetical protein ACOC0A_03705, partial [Planctomycetota bacterium]